MSKTDDRDNVLGIADYDTLNAKTTRQAIQHLELNQLSAVWKYERQQKNRITVLRAIRGRIRNIRKVLKVELQREAEKGFTILITGQTGVGKSATVNSLFGKKIAKTNDSESETTKVTPFEGTYNRVNFTIYDTPGLGEWDSDGVNLDEKYLSLMREQCSSPDVLWYALRLDVNVTAADDQYLQLIHQTFGDTVWDRAMIVFTHADKIPKPDFQRIFERKTKIVNEVIAKVTAEKSRGLPAVAVANKQKHTPDGANWLGELFTTSAEQLNPERLTPFLVVFAEDLGLPETQHPKTDASQENVQESEKEIQLTQKQVIRIEKKSTDSSGILGAIAAGASIGATVDLASGGTTLGLGAIGGGILGFIGWLLNS